MTMYWMNKEGVTSQASPYREPMVDALTDGDGLTREFTEYQVECYQKIGVIPETIYLNEEDWEFVINPPEPNEKFKALFSNNP